jgi:sporulation protein YlmC with PRC-barrel domain
MLRIKKVSDVLGRNAYTDSGDLLGQVEEVNLVDNKIDGWRIRISGEMTSLIGGARGIIVPHQFVKAVGDIFIVNKASLPIREEEAEEPETAEIEVE